MTTTQPTHARTQLWSVEYLLRLGREQHWLPAAGPGPEARYDALQRVNNLRANGYTARLRPA